MNWILIDTIFNYVLRVMLIVIAFLIYKVLKEDILVERNKEVFEG